ncbi:ribosome modulation factor [Pseudovibrio ascidiaceicola]|uniref:ribosome modulation factor n=1 Tax=Pseudovibrio ascidiaceicola TaxID=285279 RepID=UPI003D366B5D
MSETILVNEPPQDAVVATTLSKLRKFVDAAASSQGEMRAEFSKAEAVGLNLKSAKKAISLLKKGEESTKDWVAEVTQTVRYLSLSGVELTKEQLELFSFTDTTMAPVDERAYEKGLSAGRMGENQNENPHDLSTPAGQKWMEGWNKGAEERRVVLSMEPKKEPETELIKGVSSNDASDPFDDALADRTEEE